MIDRQVFHRRALTLVELTLGMVVTMVLLGGLASAMVVASRALPASESVPIATLDGSRGIEELAGELFGADAFTERTATSVQFTVPDRNADTFPETIRYSWSGVAGDPLRREYNGVASAVVGGVNDFALSYLLQTETVPGTPLPVTRLAAQTVINLPYDIDSAEQAFLVSTSTWCGMYLSPDPALLPPSVTRWKVDRLFFRAKPAGVADGAVSVQLQQADAGRLPTGVVHDQAVFLESTLNVKGWTDMVVELSAGPWFSPNEGPAVVFKPSIGTDTAMILFQAKTTPSMHVSFVSTADAGGVWMADGSQAMTSVIVEATVETGGATPAVTTYFLTRIDVALQVGSVGAARVETGVRVINAPQVTGP